MMNKYLALFLILICLFMASVVGTTGKINNAGCPSHLQHYKAVICE